MRGVPGSEHDSFHLVYGGNFRHKNKAPHDRLVVTDYNLLPDDEPLKQYYPPNFVSVGDYPLWTNGKFIGWIGILSTDPGKPINWEQHKAFIADSVEQQMDALADIYHKDFLPSKQ